MRRTFLIFLMAPVLQAQSADIPVVNPSFEQPAIAAGTFRTVQPPPPGWTPHGDIDFGLRTIGVLHPATTTLYSEPAPDGDNVAVVFLLDNFGNQTLFANSPAGMQQVLTTPLRTNTHYALEVQVGNIANDPTPPNNQFQFEGFPGYRIELLAGEVTIASSSGVVPPEGGFVLTITELTTVAYHPLAGQPLGIRLTNLNAAPGIEVNFDAVRLRATPAPDRRQIHLHLLRVLASLHLPFLIG